MISIYKYNKDKKMYNNVQFLYPKAFYEVMENRVKKYPCNYTV